MDRQRGRLVDPFPREVWQVQRAIAREAAKRGFDEIQFDYVRFPTDGKLGAGNTAVANNKETRLTRHSPVSSAWRDRELGPLSSTSPPSFFATPGFNENDTDIGQRIEELAAARSTMFCPHGYRARAIQMASWIPQPRPASL